MHSAIANIDIYILLANFPIFFEILPERASDGTEVSFVEVQQVAEKDILISLNLVDGIPCSCNTRDLWLSL